MGKWTSSTPIISDAGTAIPSLGRLRSCIGSSLVTAAMGLSMTSCIHNNAIKGPSNPMPFDVNKQTNLYVLNEIQNFYYGNCLHLLNPLPKSTIKPPDPFPPDCGTQREKRDTIIYDLKSIIDYNYTDYSRHFQETAVTTTFAAEVAAASLTAVATLVGGGDLKDMLTTASTLTQSTNVSVQKNFYEKQSNYAILAQMDADRATTWKEIADKMSKNDVDTYSLSAALNDLQDYRHAGTAVAALTSIVQKAGAQTQQAKTP